MKRALKKTGNELYYLVDGKRVAGVAPGLSGDCSSLSGNCSSLRGNCTGLCGDLDVAGMTDDERNKRIKLEDLIK